MPLCAAFPRQYRLRALWLGRRPCLGEGRNPSPSFDLLLVPSESGLAQPPSSFSLLCLVASFISQYLRLAAALTRWPGRPSRKCPRPQIHVHLTRPPSACTPAREGRKESRAGTDTRVERICRARAFGDHGYFYRVANGERAGATYL